jgi:hypothetical protein
MQRIEAALGAPEEEASQVGVRVITRRIRGRCIARKLSVLVALEKLCE